MSFTIEQYGSKKRDATGKGRSILFIIANFTEGKNALPGYKKDIGRLRGSFKNVLNCVVITEIGNKKLENLEHTDFIEALKDMQEYVDKDGEFDRFYLVVMSHGDENGIFTSNEEQIPTEDIVNHFRHDQMKSMKGLPKVFFFQACRGSQVAKAALPVYEPPQEKLPLDADIMICYASTDHCKSFVDPLNSWFLIHTVNAISRFPREDLGMIMRYVKKKVSEKTAFEVSSTSHPNLTITAYGKEGDLTFKDSDVVLATGSVTTKDGVQTIKVEARQMVTVTDNLTKRLILVDPEDPRPETKPTVNKSPANQNEEPRESSPEYVDYNRSCTLI